MFGTTTVFPNADQLKGPQLSDVAELIKNGKVKNVIVLGGAGLSVAAGLPDFRSPNTGLYSNLEKYNLPYPEAVFDIDYFQDNPAPFFTLAKELYPGNYEPTLSHCFIKLLDEKNILKRVWTQNIDCLELRTGLHRDKVLEAHGSFATAHCLECDKMYEADDIKPQIMRGEVVYCHEPKCKGKKDALVKSDIVFFGEDLPDRFFTSMGDFKTCDLLITTGTSLQVGPFNGLISKPPSNCPRLLINLERVGELSTHGRGGFDFSGKLRGGQAKARDVAYIGECDAGFKELARLCGWEDDLQSIIDRIKTEHQPNVQQTLPQDDVSPSSAEKEEVKSDPKASAEDEANKAATMIAEQLSQTKLEDPS